MKSSTPHISGTQLDDLKNRLIRQERLLREQRREDKTRIDGITKDREWAIETIADLEKQLAYTQEMVDRAVGESIRLEELESYLLNQRALLAHKEAEVLNLKQANAKLTKKLNRTIGRRLRRLWRKMLGKKDRKKLSLADDGQESTPNASPAAPTLTKEMFRQQAQQDLNRFLDGHFSIRLPIAIQPKISIILILYNQAELTYKCLDSIANQLDVSFEVIIIDNASSDRTQDLMAKVSGATIVYNKDNVGFLRAVNQACKLAKGEQILLLNNDTVIGDKAFGSASQLLDSDDSIGAVGAKLILPDGTLQEAGSLLWNDGSALGYARGENPDHYSAQFQRDVDYCSGAFLLTRTKLWQELGGFDERYAPAYYEETDFCLRLWEQGYRIVYNPHSVIYHFEFGSSKTSDEAIALQTRNRSIFLERHKDYLGTTALAPHEDNIIKARSRQNDAKKILLIDDRLPFVTEGAGFPRSNALIHALAKTGAFLTFYPLRFPQPENMDKIIDAIPAGVEIASGLGVDGFEDFLAARKSYYNQILISRSHNMKFINKLIKKRPDLFEECEIIYDAEAVTATRDIMKFDLLGQPIDEKEQLHSLNQEINLTRYADTVIAVSEKEADFYKQGGVPTVKVLGHRFDPEPTPSSFDTRKDLLFVGRLDGDFTPNEDSLIWFAREILPLIQQRSKEPLILNIAGQVNSDRVRDLANNHIRLLGRVDDLSDWYDRSRVFIAPTRFAAGIPHKVHEAANYGLPCVITDLLLSQLGWKHDQEALSASNASDFADQCVRLYEDKALWNSVRSHALEAIKQDCSRDYFENVCSELVKQ